MPRFRKSQKANRAKVMRRYNLKPLSEHGGRLDALYLESLTQDGANLPVAALMPQLRALRSDSDWRLGAGVGARGLDGRVG